LLFIRVIRVIRGSWSSSPDGEKLDTPLPTVAAPSAPLRPVEPTVAGLLQALLTDRTDAATWRALATLARMEQGDGADAYLAGLLERALTFFPPERRDALLEALAAAIAPAATGRLAATLASGDEPAARHLALLILGRMPLPLDPLLYQPLRGLLLDRRLPAEAQFSALSAAVRSAGPASPLTEELVELLVTGLGKARSIERLREFEKRFGSLPAIDTLCAQLEERLRMSCPRCGLELRRPEMIRHLWEEHRLVLDGRRVRDPWSVIEDWIDAYRARGNAELLQRCRVLAQRLDPDGGPSRLRRLLLERGVNDPAARQGLCEEARRRHAAVCPACYAAVPVPREAPPLKLIRRPGRLSAGGYGVEVSEDGWRTRLEVRTPARLLYRGPEPDHRWTVRGAVLLSAGPLVLLALAAAFVPERWVAPVAPVSILLGLSLLAYLRVRIAWPAGLPSAERMTAYAWSLLAPGLHEGGFVPEDSAFLAGLALASRGREGEDLLPELARRTERAVTAGEAPPGHLAALRRRLVEDAVARGADGVRLAVEQLARCFQGRYSLAFAEHLLEGWRTAWWTPANLARLRVLLCDRAFEAGFEVQNLLDAGRTSPALGEALQTDEPHGLAALRLLWSLRPTRPWDRLGPVTTVFELAADLEQSELLGEQPDLLLVQEEPDWLVVGDGGKGAMGPARILLCTRGVMLQEVLFAETPRVVEVLTKSVGYELILGRFRFRSPNDLEPLALRMERWFRYAFNDFLPAMAAALNWKSPDRAAILRAWGAVPCPECRREVLARVGEIGIGLDEAAGG
jgi:hypothetical protein